MNNRSQEKELVRLQQEWLALKQAGRISQGEFYAHNFAPIFIPYFKQLPLRGALPEMPRPKFLISVLGLSWQPVALMAAWCQPRCCLILGTADSFELSGGSSEKPLDRISRLADLLPSQIEWHQVGENEELDMYRHVREFLSKHHIHAREAALDITGGKKSMSSSAALAGFLTGCPIVYVDYGEFADGIPLPGTEFPRLLSNPLEVFGDLEFDHIKAAFSRGDFGEAERRSQELAEKLYSPRKAELYTQISRAYGEWANFRFANAARAMNEAIVTLRRFQVQQQWDFGPRLMEQLEAHLSLVEALEATKEKPDSLDGAFGIVLNHFAAGLRVWKEGRTSLAILLLYSTLERYIDLLLWTEYGLDDDAPDYTLLEGKLDQTRYDQCGKTIFTEKLYKEGGPEGQITLGRGMQLVAALNPELLPLDMLYPARSFLRARNKCEFEHGIKAQPVEHGDMVKWSNFVRGVISMRFGAKDAQQRLEAELAKFQFPTLP